MPLRYGSRIKVSCCDDSSGELVAGVVDLTQSAKIIGKFDLRKEIGFVQ